MRVNPLWIYHELRSMRLLRSTGRSARRQRVLVSEVVPGSFLFFVPEAEVAQHFAATCLLARTLKEKGNSVVFVRCLSNLKFCAVKDGRPETVISRQTCARCINRSVDFLSRYGLSAVDLEDVLTPSIRRRVDEVCDTIPPNPVDFVYDGIALGKLAGYDIVLSEKVFRLDSLSIEAKRLWRAKIHSALISYLAIEQLIERTRPAAVTFYNDYSLSLSGRQAAEKRSVPCFTVAHAAHLANDRRNLLVVPEIYSLQGARLSKAWDTWKDLALAPATVHEIGDDIISRLKSIGSHGYSPAKSVSRSDRFARLGLDPSKKLIVAFTSSLCENVASSLAIEGKGGRVPKAPQPFADHKDWLESLIEYVRCNSDTQLVVRVHPREDANRREGRKSEQLAQLERAFSAKQDRCTFVWPRDPVSSYDLGELAHLIAVAWSTIGLEFARLGLPVVQSLRGHFPYPIDGIFHWAETRETYFQMVTSLLARAPAPGPVIRNAFRWYHLYHLGNRLSLADVIPTWDYESLPPFKTPVEAQAIEALFHSKTTTLDLNFDRLRKIQGTAASREEHCALRIEVARILHFLLTGEETRSQDWATRINHLNIRRDALGKTLFEVEGTSRECRTPATKILAEALVVPALSLHLPVPEDSVVL